MKEYYSVFPSKRMVNGSKTGIMMRDYIAIHAMQGILANPSLVPPYITKDVVRMAYEYADAMIDESER